MTDEQLSLFDADDIGVFWDNDEDEPAELRTYDKDHCWQYEIRLRNKERDLLSCGLTEEETSSLRVGDFVFQPLTTRWERTEAKYFIRRHEWLGNLSQYTTHWFGAYYKGHLAGVLLFNLPNAFSKMLGENTPNLERLISRGACISWSPKNLASAMIMYATNWLARNTQYRLFTAYSDPMARELGTVYQACNFFYLGQTAGASMRYLNPYTGNIVSDRFFRQRSAYRRYCDELGIEWQPEWASDTGMDWDAVPDNVAKQLREFSRLKQAGAEQVPVPLKHKYAMVLGANRAETRALRAQFLSMNQVFPYPKER